MPQWIIELLAKHYDENHGVANSRPVVDAVIKESKQPFRDVSDTFAEASRQWQLPLVDAMRALAATGYCKPDDGVLMLNATQTVAEDAGTEEYFKTVNAMASAQASAPALVTYVLSLLREPSEFQRRLAFYAVALLIDKHTAMIPDQLRTRLRVEADREQFPERQMQFRDVLARL